MKKSKFNLRPPCWLVTIFLLFGYCSFEHYYDNLDLEFSGYCPEDGKTYTPQQIADKAIDKIIDIYRGRDNFPYTSRDEFYERNPQCCQLYTWTDYSSLGWQKAERFVLNHILRLKISYAYELSISYKDMKSENSTNSFGFIVDACGNKLEYTVGASRTRPVQFIKGHP